jgi:gamma-tubulin complex component 3
MASALGALPPRDAADSARAQAYGTLAECERLDFEARARPRPRTHTRCAHFSNPRSALSAARLTAALARAHRRQVPESELVRDVIFVCQGINGRYIRYDAAAEGYVIDPSVGIPRAARQLAQRLCEAGWLFRRLRAALAPPGGAGGADGRGATARAFAAAVGVELNEYYRLVAMLEAQAQLPLPGPRAASAAASAADGSAAAAAAPYLTLRRLDAWLAEPLARLRLLAVLADAARGAAGGALAAALHAHAAHGDPGARALVAALLRAACAPLFDALAAWVTRGELDADADEFFVSADVAVPEEHLWRRGYALRPEALPPFITPEQAAHALRIGKSINFLRRGCGDGAWAADAPAVLAAAAAAGGLAYGNAPALEALLRAGATAVDARVRDALFLRFRLGDHCAAIKRYLLLGQGDFIATLMDAVGPALSERAAAVSDYKLMGVLEAAIRASNAQFDDPDVLGRLRVRLMPHAGGESGWDVFSLEYVVTAPLTTLLTEEALGKYLRVFNFLWRLKRVEHALNATWHAMKPAGGAASAPRRRGADGAPAPPPPLAAELRRCHMLRAEMAHFVTNLQYYIMFEVLEHSWVQFTEEMGAAQDLDGLISSHERYLDAIVAKALLGERSALLAQQLSTLFELMLRFRGLADRVCDAARDAAAQASLAALASRLGGAPEDGAAAPGASAAAAAAELAPDAAAQLDILSSDYATLLEGFLSLLPVQRHVDLRSLLFRLDFSEFYSDQHGQQHTTPARGGPRASLPGGTVQLNIGGARAAFAAARAANA